jgi:transposase InsO family protein
VQIIPRRSKVNFGTNPRKQGLSTSIVNDIGQLFRRREFPYALRRRMDNVFIERLWRSLKYEDIYLKDYVTVRAVEQEWRPG